MTINVNGSNFFVKKTTSELSLQAACSAFDALMLIVMFKNNFLRKYIATLVTFFHNVKKEKNLKKISIINTIHRKKKKMLLVMSPFFTIYKSRTYKNS